MSTPVRPMVMSSYAAWFSAMSGSRDLVEADHATLVARQIAGLRDSEGLQRVVDGTRRRPLTAGDVGERGQLGPVCGQEPFHERPVSWPGRQVACGLRGRDGQ